MKSKSSYNSLTLMSKYITENLKSNYVIHDGLTCLSGVIWILLSPSKKNMRDTAVVLKNATLRRVLPFFSALRCVAPLFQH
jgi:hypothetical protein